MEKHWDLVRKTLRRDDDKNINNDGNSFVSTEHRNFVEDTASRKYSQEVKKAFRINIDYWKIFIYMKFSTLSFFSFILSPKDLLLLRDSRLYRDTVFYVVVLE